MLLRKEINFRIDEAKEEILGNREQAEFIRGMVHAFREVLEWEPNITEEE